MKQERRDYDWCVSHYIPYLSIIWDDNEVGRRHGGSYSTGCIWWSHTPFIFSDLPLSRNPLTGLNSNWRKPTGNLHSSSILLSLVSWHINYRSLENQANHNVVSDAPWQETKKNLQMRQIFFQKYRLCYRWELVDMFYFDYFFSCVSISIDRGVGGRLLFCSLDLKWIPE